MTWDNVFSGDMEPNHLSDEQIEGLLAGLSTTSAEEPIALFVEELRETLTTQGGTQPTPALAEYLGVTPAGVMFPPDTHRVDEIEIVDLRATSAPSRKKHKMFTSFTSFTAFAGTAVGKIAFGTAVAAASVAGAHSVGIVDVPILPDTNSREIVLATDSSSSTSSTSTSTSTTSSTPTTAVTTPGSTAPTSPSPTSTSTSSTSTPATVSGAFTFTLPGVGTVSVEASEGKISPTGTSAEDGWTGSVLEVKADEVEFRFTNGTDTIDIEVEIDHGLWQVRVLDRSTDDRELFWFDQDGNPVTSPPGHSDDHDVDDGDDDSRRENDHDDDDEVDVDDDDEVDVDDDDEVDVDDDDEVDVDDDDEVDVDDDDEVDVDDDDEVDRRR